jgi:hypothetical protein
MYLPRLLGRYHNRINPVCCQVAKAGPDQVRSLPIGFLHFQNCFFCMQCRYILIDLWAKSGVVLTKFLSVFGSGCLIAIEIVLFYVDFEKLRHRYLENDYNQGILKVVVSLYHWPPVWLIWNQLYDNCQFLFLFAKQTNPNQSNRRSMVQWFFPL